VTGCSNQAEEFSIDVQERDRGQRKQAASPTKPCLGTVAARLDPPFRYLLKRAGRKATLHRPRPEPRGIRIHHFIEDVTMKKTQGFTLIELMIVVAIIAILAAIALPAYQNYIKRSKVSEGVVAADACKASLVEYVASENSMPPTAQAAGCGNFNPTQYVTALTYTPATGSIAVTYGNVGTGVDGLLYDLRPNSVASAVSGQLTGWTCTNSSVRPELLPASCR